VHNDTLFLSRWSRWALKKGNLSRVEEENVYIAPYISKHQDCFIRVHWIRPAVKTYHRFLHDISLIIIFYDMPFIDPLGNFTIFPVSSFIKVYLKLA